jgi:hypothetical protein
MCLTDIDVAIALARERLGRLAEPEVTGRERGDSERDPAGNREPVPNYDVRISVRLPVNFTLPV